MKRLFIFIVAVTFCLTTANAQQVVADTLQRGTKETVSVPRKKSHFLPTARRIDRNIDLKKFVY